MICCGKDTNNSDSTRSSSVSNQKNWITKYLFFVANFCFYAGMCDNFEESLLPAERPDMHNYLEC